MKIRQGFVSNSSSSSFVIVGVHGTLAEEVSKKDHAKFEWGGCGTGDTKEISYADWDESSYNDDTDECTFYYAGLNAEKLLKTKHYNEIALEAKKILEKILGKPIKLSDIDLHFGETSSG